MQNLLVAITTESRWIAPSVALGIIAAVIVLRTRGDDRSRVTAAMSAYGGVMLATMASGHVLAVTLLGFTDELRANPILLYAIGLVLLAPALYIATSAFRRPEPSDPDTPYDVRPHLVLIVALLLSGPRSLPLAVPIALACAYARHRRAIVGRLLILTFVVTTAVMAVGSIHFFASGISFEEFGMTQPAP